MIKDYCAPLHCVHGRLPPIGSTAVATNAATTVARGASSGPEDLVDAGEKCQMGKPSEIDELRPMRVICDVNPFETGAFALLHRRIFPNKFGGGVGHVRAARM